MRHLPGFERYKPQVVPVSAVSIIQTIDDDIEQSEDDPKVTEIQLNRLFSVPQENMRMAYRRCGVFSTVPGTFLKALVGAQGPHTSGAGVHTQVAETYTAETIEAKLDEKQGKFSSVFPSPVEVALFIGQALDFEIIDGAPLRWRASRTAGDYPWKLKGRIACSSDVGEDTVVPFTEELLEQERRGILTISSRRIVDVVNDPSDRIPPGETRRYVAYKSPQRLPLTRHIQFVLGWKGAESAPVFLTYFPGSELTPKEPSLDDPPEILAQKRQFWKTHAVIEH